MEQMVTLANGRAGAEDWVSDHQAFALAYSGRLQQAKRMASRSAEMARAAAQKERAAQFEVGPVLWDAFFGNPAAAKKGATAVLDHSKGRDVEYGAALAMVLAGDSAGAQTLLNDLTKRFPEDTSVRFNYTPVLKACLALNQNEPAQAIEALQSATVYELGVPLSWYNANFGALYPIYVRGQAYLAAHKGVEAAAEFQKMVDHRTIPATDPIGALARLQLGRALVVAGDKSKARTAYQEFLELWKDADPDLPILKQAKAEFAGL
jgi:TolA-binding protein